MPRAIIEPVCSCCKRVLHPASDDHQKCWECKGRPETDPLRNRRRLSGLRDKACPHALPGGE